MMTGTIHDQRYKSVTMINQKEMIMRTRRALWLVLGMLCLSVLLAALGIYTTTRTESLSITGYSSGVILAFGSFLGVLGLCLEENRVQLLVAAIIFLSLGIIASFLCLVMDGVFIVLNMDVRPLRADRCQFYTSGSSYIYENYYTSVQCQSLRESCSLRVRSGTCYCCDLYNCASGGYLNNYYEFVGVESCQDVLTLHMLIWVLTCLNLVAFIMGILTTAVLGSIKHLSSTRFSMLSLGGSDPSSPTAPLLMDTSSHTGLLSGSLYSSPATRGSTTQREMTHLDANPLPFAPMYNPLPFKPQGFSI